MAASVTLNRKMYEAYFKEVNGAELKDAGKPGEVDAGDVLIKNGQRKLTLGKDRFEKARMQLHVVAAAKAFAAAGVKFSGSSREDAVNKNLWWMGYGGKMGVRQGVKPSDAINDIFENGDQYGMECATATMVILHKAILDRIGPDDFDSAFAKLKLFRWSIEDPEFTEVKRQGKLPGYLPGDHTYFRNPDFDPSNSAFQGENVIYLGNGEYFGHGLGIKSEREVIKGLNDLRRPGATRSAFRDDFEVRLSPKGIAALDLQPE